MTILPLLQDASPASSGPNPLIMLVGVMVIMFIVVFLPERKARKKKEAMISAIKKNDRVLLTSGMYATVAAVNEGELTVRFDDGQTRVRIVKSAIGQVVTQDAETGKEPAGS